MTWAQERPLGIFSPCLCPEKKWRSVNFTVSALPGIAVIVALWV